MFTRNSHHLYISVVGARLTLTTEKLHFHNVDRVASRVIGHRATRWLSIVRRGARAASRYIRDERGAEGRGSTGPPPLRCASHREDRARQTLVDNRLSDNKNSDNCITILVCMYSFS